MKKKLSKEYCLRTLLCCIFCCMCSVISMAATTELSNRLYTPDMIAWRGVTTYLPIYMDNTQDVTAVQFNIGIPREMKVGQDAFRLSDRASDHTIQARLIKTDETKNWYMVMVFSATNSLFTGRTGKILDIRFTMGDEAQEGTYLTPGMTDAVMSTPDKLNVLQEIATGNITIEFGPDLIVPSVNVENTQVAPNGQLNLSWTVKNSGQETCSAGWSEEISIIDVGASSENYTSFITRYLGMVKFEGTLAGGASVSRNASLMLPPLIGLDRQCRIMVRIVPFPESNERPEFRINNNTVSQQTIEIAKVLSLDLNHSQATEGTPTAVTATLNRSGRWNREETFHITSSGDSRVSVPATVKLPAGQSAARFPITITDNDELDPFDAVATITVSDPATSQPYEAISQQLTIEDDEQPALALAASPSTVGEGETIVFTVTAERAATSDLPLYLTCDVANRFEIPSDIILPKGKNSIQVSVLAKDDDVPATTLSPTFTASAPGYTSAQVITILTDDDMPAINFTLSPATLTESAGPIAMNAVLRRTSNIDKEITIKLSDDSPLGDINYGRFATLTMASGVEEVKFNIGINDNLTVDGDRSVTITAAVFLQSCSCSASNESVGVASQVVDIIDNDGPTITLTSSRSMLLEGTDEATILTISRNTDTTSPLSVTVTSDYDEGLYYTHQVVIPSGEREVRVAVKALANSTEGDSHVITFTAEAAGHNSGVCWAMISDQTLPDAVVSHLELYTADDNSIGSEGVVANATVQARVTIANASVVALPEGVAVNVYQSGGNSPSSSLKTAAPLAPGSSVTLTCSLRVPSTVGTFSTYAKVNEEETVSELLYTNNTSPTVTINVRAPYLASLSIDKTALQMGDSVTIRGRITRPEGSSWDGGAANVHLYFLADGQRFVKELTTDANGTFTYVWTPSRSQIGHVGIGACYPGESLSKEMVGIDIYGLRRTGSGNTTCYTVLDQPYTGAITVYNPGRLPLTNVKVAVADNPDGATVIINTPQTIAGGETANINYTLTSHKIPTNSNWQTVALNMTTAEGATLNHTISYYTRNPQAQLSSSTKRIVTTMTKGRTRDYTFYITNVGLGNTGMVSLSLPDWMQSVTPQRMASMKQGDTTQVVIRFVPTESMPLNLPVTGQIGINCENGQGLAIPFSIEPVSEYTGSLIVDVCDEYTYYTEEAPHLCGATVTLQHPATGAVISQDTTNVNGLFAVTLPEGYYTLTVTHPKHSSYRGDILIDPGTTTRKVVNLSISTIEVSWDVVETTVEDTYNIVTSVKYETNVPAPVVVVSMPSSIPAKELAEGESLVFYATLTNVGLITAKGVGFSLPQGFKVLTFEALDYNEPFELAPQQSVVIPFKVTNNSTNPADIGRKHIKPVDNDPCYADYFWSWFYECGTDSVYHKYPSGINTGPCDKKEITDGSGTPDGGDYVDIGLWGTTSGGDYRRPDTSTLQSWFDAFASEQKPKESTGEPYHCQPCVNTAMMALAKLIPFVKPVFEAAETAKDVINCAISYQNEETWHDKLAGCKYTEPIITRYDNYANKVKSLYDNFGTIADAGIDIYEHAKNHQFFTEDCLADWMTIYDTYYNAINDIEDLEAQTQDAVDKMSDMYEKTKDLIQEGQKMGEDLKAEMDRVFYNSSDYQDELRLDHIANGETSLSRKKQEADRRQNLEDAFNYAQKDLATADDYAGFLKKGIQALTGERLSRKDRQEMGQEGLNILSNFLYNLHDANDAKSKTYTQQAMIKNAFLDNTAWLQKRMPEIVDLVDSSLGNCDYEGTEQPTEKTADNSIPNSVKEFKEKMHAAVDLVQAEHDMTLEYFGSEEWLNLKPFEMASVSWAVDKVKAQGIAAIDQPNIGIYCPNGISEETLRTFLHRWNNTYGTPPTTPAQAGKHSVMAQAGKIDTQRMAELSQKAFNSLKVITEGQDASIGDIIEKQLDKAFDDVTTKSEAVCASISLQFHQTMTMARQAFRGTLKVKNGNTSDAMTDVVLLLEIRNAADGSIATSREMQISAESLNGFEGSLSLTDGWTLAAGAEGTAGILFIPTKYAAPTQPQEYTFGGRLKYLDPYTHTVVTRELSPVTLIVKPAPEIDLTYFMQRDVIGDDPLTTDVVEPSDDAEFALLVHNKGYGEAANVVMTTQQPEIIDNAKGLHIDFELMSSQLNGEEHNLALGESVTTNFGNLPSGATAYAQWWIRSSLLGHFTDYQVEATHVSSYGNPDLSLLSQVSIHELIRSLDAGTDGQRLTGFMTNDVADDNDMPDMLYLTDGTTATVATAASASIVKTSDSTYELTVTPSSTGWNYGHLSDPTYGMADLNSVVRKSDGQAVSLRNFWLTDRTLRDGKEPLYENRLHFADHFADASPQVYTLTFSPIPAIPLNVVAIEGAPEQGILATEPVNTVNVVFSKPIVPQSFSTDDITLCVQGVRQDVSKVAITTSDNKTFRLDFSRANESLPNGYYALTVQTAGITDHEGFTGKNGKSVGWVMYRNGMVVIKKNAYPQNSGVITVAELSAGESRSRRVMKNVDNEAQYGSTLLFSAAPSEGYVFANWTMNGEVMSTDSEFQCDAINDMNIEANFSKQSYLVTVLPSDSGFVSDCSGYYAYGDTITLTAEANPSFAVDHWEVNGQPSATTPTLSMVVRQPLTIRAQFCRELFPLSMQLSKGWNWVSSYLCDPLPVEDFRMGVARIVGQHTEAIFDYESGYSGNLLSLTPLQTYKVEANRAVYLSFSGGLIKASQATADVQSGWNWMGYPWNVSMPLQQALTGAEEGDFLVSQTGFAEYTNGRWEGSLTTMEPGKGYLLKSASAKTVAFAPCGSKPSDAETATAGGQALEPVDIHVYPNTMNIVAHLYDGENLVVSGDYVVYAMTGAECRGASISKDGYHYLTVYGDAAEQIAFIVEKISSGETFMANEAIVFAADIVGNHKGPYSISFGDGSGITGLTAADGRIRIFGIDGTLLNSNANHRDLKRLKPGIYIVNGRKYVVK